MKKYKLDEYENEILTSVENNEWKSIDNLEEEKMKLKNYVKFTTEKMMQIKIDIPEKDMLFLKRKSFENGVPFEIILRSVIHNFAIGKLKINI